jgi:hypothetical protein
VEDEKALEHLSFGVPRPNLSCSHEYYVRIVYRMYVM